MVSKTLSLTRFDAKFCKKMASSLQSRSRLRSRKSRSDCIKCYRIRFYYKKNFALLLSSSFALRAAVKWKKNVCEKETPTNRHFLIGSSILWVFLCFVFEQTKSKSFSWRHSFRDDGILAKRRVVKAAIRNNRPWNGKIRLKTKAIHDWKKWNATLRKQLEWQHQKKNQQSQTLWICHK